MPKVRGQPHVAVGCCRLPGETPPGAPGPSSDITRAGGRDAYATSPQRPVQWGSPLGDGLQNGALFPSKLLSQGGRQEANSTCDSGLFLQCPCACLGCSNWSELREARQSTPNRLVGQCLQCSSHHPTPEPWGQPRLRCRPGPAQLAAAFGAAGLHRGFCTGTPDHGPSGITH